MPVILRVIAAREGESLRRDGRARVLGWVFLILTLASAFAGGRYALRLGQERSAAWADNRRQFLEQGIKNPHSAAHYGVYAFKPAQALAVFDRGIEPWVGATVWLEAHKQNDFKYRPAMDAGVMQRFGELSPAFILQVIAPLLIIFLSYASFSGERESRVLKLALSQGVSPEILAWGKWMGFLRALLVWTILPWTAAIAASLFLAEPGTRMDVLLRLGWLSLAYAFYIAFWIAVVLGVSARMTKPRNTLLALLGIWLAACVLVPRFAVALSKAVSPTPLAAEFSDQISKETQRPDSMKLDKANALRLYGAKTIEELPVSFSGIRLIEGERHGDQIFDRRFSELFGILERQRDLHLVTGLASPLQPLRLASMALAGTDLSVHRDFAFKAEQYRRAFIRRLNDDVLRNAKRQEKWDSDYRGGPDLWASMPAFEYPSFGVDHAIGQAWRSLAMLSAWLMAGLWFMRNSARRLNVD
ncbi:DUF3526 domain-containing protein [bacterium]|nr:DUF3526 domain-containing protein [bacterium]